MFFAYLYGMMICGNNIAYAVVYGADVHDYETPELIDAVINSLKRK